MAINNLFPVFDGHNGTLARLNGWEEEKQRSFFVESENGHLDLPRARRGGFAGGFFAIFSPNPEYEKLMRENLVITSTGYEVLPLPALDFTSAQQWTISTTAYLFRLEAESQGQIKVVRTADELERCLQEGI